MSVAMMEMEVDGITSDAAAVVNPWQTMRHQKRPRMPQDDFYISGELVHIPKRFKPNSAEPAVIELHGRKFPIKNIQFPKERIQHMHEKYYPNYKPYENHKGIKVSQTNFKFLPKEKLEELPLTVQEVDFSSNKLETFPNLSPYLPCWTILNLANNCLTEAPVCINELVTLKEINLSFNKLNSLDTIDFTKLPALERLHFQKIGISKLPSSIGSLERLELLILFDNKLEDLPNIFHKLPNLECLGLDGNKCGLPEVVLKATSLVALHVRCTGLKSLPEGLKAFRQLKLLSTGGNEIKVYPHWLFTELNLTGLHLGDESQICIPPSAICSSDERRVRNMRAYYESLSKSGNNFDERLKVLFVGDTMAGKTSLLESILKAVPTLTAEESRTVCVDVHEYLLPSSTSEHQEHSLTVNFWDFGGHDSYYFSNQLFLTPNALVILTIDAAKYLRDPVKGLEDSLLWVRKVLARIPDAKFLVAATHIDLVEDHTKLQNLEKELLEQIHLEGERRRKTLQTVVDRVERKEGTLRKRMKKLARENQSAAKRLLKRQPELPKSVIFVSNANGKGHELFVKELGKICASNFPNLVSYIPLRWKCAEEVIKKQFLPRNPVTLVEQVKGCVYQKFSDISENEFLAMLEYFSSSGVFCYFPEIPILKNLVFTDPTWLISIFKPIFSPLCDMKETILSFEFYSNLEKKELLDNLEKRGLLCEEILAKLWDSFLPSCTAVLFHNKEKAIVIFLSILQAFSLCYEVPLKDGKRFGRQYLFPTYIPRLVSSEKLDEVWELSSEVSDIPQIACCFSFSDVMPASFFELLSCSLHALCPEKALQFDRGAFGLHRRTGIKLFISVQSSVAEMDEASMLKITAQYNSKVEITDDAKPWRLLWEVVLPLIMKGHEMISLWQGLVVYEWLICPHCGSREALRPANSKSSSADSLCFHQTNWLSSSHSNSNSVESNQVCCMKTSAAIPMICVCPPRDILDAMRTQTGSCQQRIPTFVSAFQGTTSTFTLAPVVPPLERMAPLGCPEAHPELEERNKAERELACDIQAGEVSDFELDILSLHMLELWQSGKYTFRELASSVLKLPPATILNVRIEATTDTSTDFSKIFNLFYAWREGSVNNTRLKLAKILMDENLYEVLEQCLLKNEQTTEDLFPNMTLEKIEQEITDCGVPDDITPTDRLNVVKSIIALLNNDWQRFPLYLGGVSYADIRNVCAGRRSEQEKFEMILQRWQEDRFSTRASLIRACRIFRANSTAAEFLKPET